MKDKIKVMIVDDHPVIRWGLAEVITEDSTLVVIDEAENGEVALQKLKHQLPDIVILDINMPVLNGYETAKIINSIYPQVKIIFLSIYEEPEMLNLAFSLDIMGYVVKDNGLVEIIDCLVKVSKGERYFSAGVFRNFDTTPFEITKGNSLLSLLSSTELQILHHISEARTNGEVAKKLSLSVRTIENHRLNICKKLNIQGSHALFKFVLENKNQVLEDLNKIK